MHKIIQRIMAVILILFGFLAFASAQNHNLDRNNTIVLTLKDGDVAIQLRPDLAPKHVDQVEKLVKEGAYDNVVFHRVIPGFMAQTGDVRFGKKGGEDYNPRRAGMGGSHYPDLYAEFSKEHFKRGTVGMARSQNPNSANSQFFICYEDAPFLDGQYTIIGQVIKGMDIVDKIKKGSTSNNGAVDDPDIIIKAHMKTQ
ncbi:peptidylprolyl isomerase [Bartonella tamiae]|uniref:Peptidyl-prolyl cis-trans isomerase n=1 Tax=Bartonella tamiae Th239 TaxID=1094558 RepID=J1JWJ9_9HYPH|nr:peptidylprolyl isomerase [Bartonella tamiae]EJF88940.1 hypothetical protein ME5_01491 [Bartonella tamiae Th239]EJF94810.1 hypothetical protein MEG_00391 [Bartonella tamiae Th307]